MTATLAVDLLDDAILDQLAGDDAAHLRTVAPQTLGPAGGRSVTRRYQIPGGDSLILKRTLHTDIDDVDEAALVHELRRAGLPVPQRIAATRFGPWRAALIYDLGPAHPRYPPATLEEVTAVAGWIHALDVPPAVPVLDAWTLAGLPARGLRLLGRLPGNNRPAAQQIRYRLDRLVEPAHHHAPRAGHLPSGLCHGQLHPTRLHRGTAGWAVLGWSRAHRGPLVLDLAAIHTGLTPRPDWTTLLTSYGADQAPRAQRVTGDRGGIAVQRWAVGWHRLLTATRTLAETAAHATTLHAGTVTSIITDLDEALHCLTDDAGAPGPRHRPEPCHAS
nr:hypothetical protein GCM10020063_009980 [Dactylosporangium thailandense]